MKLVLSLIVSIVVYLTCLTILTFTVMGVFSALWFGISQEWVWMWELARTPALIVFALSVGIANYLVEDYINCQCEEERG